MDLLLGENLRQRVTEHGPASLEQGLGWMMQVLRVLEVAHARGIVHRDIKPDNVFLESSGSVRVLDFGLARLRDGMSSAHRTKSGVPLGTIGYMPPEQALGQVEQMSTRSDVWAAAATLFTVLTGEKVHAASTQVDGMFLAMTAPVKRLAERLPHVPQAIIAVLARALAFSQEARFEDARALRLALEAAQMPGLGSAPVGLSGANRSAAQGTVVFGTQGPSAPVPAERASPRAAAFVSAPHLATGSHATPMFAKQPTFFEVFAPGQRTLALPRGASSTSALGASARAYLSAIPAQVIWGACGFALCFALGALFVLVFLWLH
jgi:eukaryotic-like serine/threonine-protein kinase